MAKEKITEETVEKTINNPAESNAPETPAEQTVEMTADEKAMVETKATLEKKVAEFNTAAKFAEGAKMTRLDGEIKELAKKYKTYAENKCFNELLSTADPMAQAAIIFRFHVIDAKRTKSEAGLEMYELGDGVEVINPMRLHNKSSNGIGAQKDWWSCANRLLKVLTVRNAAKRGIDADGIDRRYKIDPTSDKDSRIKTPVKIEGKLDRNVEFELIKLDLQETVSAMLGSSYKVEDTHVEHILQSVTSVNSRNTMDIKSAKAGKFTASLLAVCHKMLTDEEFTVSGYDVKSGM